MAFGDELVTRGTTFGLRALRGKQVTEAGRAANQLSGSGNFEALGDGLFGLLHGEKGRKQRPRAAMARGKLGGFSLKTNPGTAGKAAFGRGDQRRPGCTPVFPLSSVRPAAIEAA